jgi:hypothetical protein
LALDEQSSSQIADRDQAVVVRLSGRDLGLYLGPTPMGKLVLRADGDLRRGRFPWRTPAFWMAAMDLIGNGIKHAGGVGTGTCLRLPRPVNGVLPGMAPCRLR